MAADHQTILNRAILGKRLRRSRVFRPSWFYYLTQDPFWVWCEYFAPKSKRVDETTRYDRFRMRLGVDREDRYVDEKFPNAYVVKSRWGMPALQETIRAMIRGELAIHGASLWLLGKNVYGKADVLVRSDKHASDLGGYHYRVKEVKNSKVLKEYHQLQAATYTWILSEMQGYCPDTFDVVLKEGEGEETIAYQDVAAAMNDHLSQWQSIRDGRSSPSPLGYDTTPSPWRRYSNEFLTHCDDISLLPGVGPKTAVKLRDRELGTLDDIRNLGPDGCIREFNNDHRYYHALAYQSGKPVFRPGSSVSIPSQKRIVYLDVEDVSVLDGEYVTRPHVYMIGVATPNGDTKVWTARGQDDEGRIWQEFLDWIGEPNEVVIYCWSNYEFGKLLQAATDHTALAPRLIAAEAALVDQKEQVKHRPYFPVSSYSIKSVAPVCGFYWSQDDVDGQTAQLMYTDWLRTGDDTIIRKVEQYNREDVLAMLAVDRYVNEA